MGRKSLMLNSTVSVSKKVPQTFQPIEKLREYFCFKFSGLSKYRWDDVLAWFWCPEDVAARSVTSRLQKLLISKLGNLHALETVAVSPSPLGFGIPQTAHKTRYGSGSDILNWNNSEAFVCYENKLWSFRLLWKQTLKISFVVKTNSEDFVCCENKVMSSKPNIFANVESLSNKVTTLRRLFLTHADFSVSKSTTFVAC